MPMPKPAVYQQAKECHDIVKSSTSVINCLPLHKYTVVFGYLKDTVVGRFLISLCLS